MKFGDFSMLVGSGRAAPKWGAQRPKSGAQRRPKAQRAQRAAPRRRAGGTCPLHAENDLPFLPKSRFCRIDVADAFIACDPPIGKGCS